MRFRTPLLAASLLVPVACGSPTGAAMAQELARDHNLNARMGRMELAAENVDPEFQPKWTEQHKDWGTLVRLADSEVSGTRPSRKATKEDKGPVDVFVFVKIAWYRADEGDLHATVVRQRWTAKRGGWVLAGEDRESGEPGLFGDYVPTRPPVDPSAAPKGKKFSPTTLTGEN